MTACSMMHVRDAAISAVILFSCPASMDTKQLLLYIAYMMFHQHVDCIAVPDKYSREPISCSFSRPVRDPVQAQ